MPFGPFGELIAVSRIVSLGVIHSVEKIYWYLSSRSSCRVLRNLQHTQRGFAIVIVDKPCQRACIQLPPSLHHPY